MYSETISITQLDLYRLNSLVENTTDSDSLQNEVERARVVDFPEVATDLVTMNTRFRYLNITDDKTAEIMIVYPKDANTREGMISVLAPLGTALIGLREQEEIDWAFPDGKTKKLKVLEILYQPESSGDLHL